MEERFWGRERGRKGVREGGKKEFYMCMMSVKAVMI